jgi:hemerythrin-like domain-containing protein
MLIFKLQEEYKRFLATWNNLHSDLIRYILKKLINKLRDHIKKTKNLFILNEKTFNVDDDNADWQIANTDSVTLN